MEKISKQSINVLMLGDSLSKQGGIVTLEKHMLKYAPSDIQIQHIGTAVDGSAIQKACGFAIALVRVVLVLLTAKIDIVHMHVAERGSAYRKSIVTLIAKFVFRKPVLLHSNSPEFHEFYQGLSPNVQRGLLWAFCQCDRFLAVSDRWRNFYVDKFGLKPEQVLVLANPIELPERVPQRERSNQINLVFLGRIGQRKGAFDLIRAFALLPEPVRERANLVLAGDGEIEKARDLVTSYSSNISNIGDRITIYNWLNSEQRDALLAKADIFALPTYNEGLPLALLEAMGWGLPVITTPVGGIPDIITSNSNGLLINPGDLQQLYKAMQSLIRDDRLRFSLGSNARASVATFDIKNYYISLRKIYDSILELEQSEYAKITQ